MILSFTFYNRKIHLKLMSLSSLLTLFKLHYLHVLFQLFSSAFEPNDLTIHNSDFLLFVLIIYRYFTNYLLKCYILFMIFRKIIFGTSG